MTLLGSLVAAVHRKLPLKTLTNTLSLKRSAYTARTVTTMSSKTMFALDSFCLRQFKDPSNVAYIDMEPNEFMEQLEAACQEEVAKAEDGNILHDGYAPFCKHVFVKNFTKLQVNTLPINDVTKPLIESGYDARTNKELPVLVRYVTKSTYEKAVGAPLPVAKYLDIILYSREQIIKESASMGVPKPTYDQEWAVISVKPQDADRELPMNPITVMRNGLGMDQGGSGKPIIRAEYMASVEYWQDHVAVRQQGVKKVETNSSADADES